MAGKMMESMRIGGFRLARMESGEIWIEIVGDGEGGAFKEDEVEGAIAKFYADNF